MNKAFKILSKPYLFWLLVFAIVPIVVMFFLTFISSEGLSFSDSFVSFNAFILFMDESTLVAIGNSFLYASIATVIAIILGYFIAYQLFKSRIRNKLIILTLFILPMWSNLLLRTEALGNVMTKNNIITSLLQQINISVAIDIKGTALAVIIGLVFTYLPFIILPVYTALEKIDISLEEASLDLGVTEFKTFWKVIFPLSLKGVVTGSIMVFLPALSGFAVPEILGSGNVLFIGNIIEQTFKNMNYNFGSLLALFILVLILGAILIVNKVDKEGETLL